MAISDPTFIGQVAAVASAVVRVRLRDDMPTLVLVDGESYRVGQIGAFLRVPLGYVSLFGVCTQVGADAAPPQHVHTAQPLEYEEDSERLSGYRWMAITLFGEAVGRVFERGVSQYPTIGDEVHLVTSKELRLVYSAGVSGTVSVGEIAAVSGIPAHLDVSRLISRHSAVLGSTGSGKSNFVTVLLEVLASAQFPSSRIVIVDPHGEYATALGNQARVLKLDAEEDGQRLRVPYWALRFSEIQEIALGGLQPNTEAALRDQVQRLKRAAAQHLAAAPPVETVTADSPIPFSIRRLWFELDDFERQTFKESNNQTEDTMYEKESVGSAEALTPNRYPPPSAYNTPPYPNRQARHIRRQLDLLRSRLADSRFGFMFQPGGGLDCDDEGRVQRDLDSLVAQWVGRAEPITVLDTSGVPSEILSIVVGTMLRLIWDVLFWGADLGVGGRNQPLLVVLEEAHRFLPEGGESPANRTLGVIAKEGRKYGVGLMAVTQRPTEIDSTVLSQVGTIIALRTTNSADRQKVSSALPDELAGLSDLLPALRTGEGIFLGEALQIPSRVRIRKAKRKPIGDDPKLPEAWQQPVRPDESGYTTAVDYWRRQTTRARDDGSASDA